jgi:hypothetical protein
VSFRVKSALTFVAVVVVSAGVLAGGGAAQADQVWYQGYERVSSSEACTAQPGETPWQASWGSDASWHPSWEMWANGGRGGWTCWRSITWARDPVAPTASTASCGSASGTYSIGDIGPGCGIVFYKDLTQPAGKQYMEAAPTDWNGAGLGDPDAEWGCEGIVMPGTFGTAIGTGQTNTANIVGGGGCATAGIAARLASDYTGGGLPAGSWFLPSLDELNELDVRDVGGLAAMNYYQSSSQIDGNTAWVQTVGFGDPRRQDADPKGASGRVRPVRAF